MCVRACILSVVKGLLFWLFGHRRRKKASKYYRSRHIQSETKREKTTPRTNWNQRKTVRLLVAFLLLVFLYKYSFFALNQKRYGKYGASVVALAAYQ